jgi:phosphomannomutase
MTLIASISGIRGTVGGKPQESLSPLDIVKITAAYGIWAKYKTDRNRIVIGRDARVSGKMISQLVANTLIAQGYKVIDLGLCPTPTVEMAVVWEDAAGGIIISASHNPIQWNALKLLSHKGEFILPEDVSTIVELAKTENFNFVEYHKLGEYTVNNSYIKRHTEEILKLEIIDKEAIKKRKFKIVVDAVNSVGGIAVPELLNALGIDSVEKIFCEPNGLFYRNPEPLPENLTKLSQTVVEKKFDLGISVDPDVDRLAFVCEDGSVFGEEYTLVAVADYVLSKEKGNTVSNLSSTRALKDISHKRGVNHTECPVGEVHVVKAMKETNAVIGGEGNGGVIYPKLHYGRDALVGIALFLSHLATQKKSALQLRMSLPDYHISKKKIELDPSINLDLILKRIKEKYSKNPVNTDDGVKIDLGLEWVHLRKSNTEPIIRIYAESDSQNKADLLANKLISDIKEVLSEKISV